MKTTSLALTLSFTLAACAALAADKVKEAKEPKEAAADKAKSSPAKSSHRDTKVALTGSYIKRDIRRRGEITDGPNVVAVLDSKTIKNSGAADLRQLLVRTGAHH